MSTSCFNSNCACLSQKDTITCWTVASLSTQNNTYYSWVKAKNESIIPERNGIALHSRYNPQTEATRNNAAINVSGCTIFWGLGAGYHITPYLQMLSNTSFSPYARILIIEPDTVGLSNILENCDISTILNHPSVSLTVYDTTKAQEKVDAFLLENFNPVLQQTFTCIPLRPVAEMNKKAYETLQKHITTVMEKIKNDFSVQAHFGKIWIRNIIQNATTLQTCTISDIALYCKNEQKHVAAVIAAGPTLEDNLDFLSANKKSLFIIATDTSHQTLLAAGITADMVISIDGQNASHLHAMHGLRGVRFFAADMCANSALLRIATYSGCSILLLSGGHPLSRKIAQKTQQYSSVFTAAGTVTASAVDIAFQTGFSVIMTVGADFANTHGKPYARGTYLADLYDNAATRVSTAENLYTALLFRTECKKTNLTYSSPVLDRYSIALNNYCLTNSIHLITPIEYSKLKQLQPLRTTSCYAPCQSIEQFLMTYTSLLNRLKTTITISHVELTPLDELHDILLTILPIASWYTIHRSQDNALIDAIDHSLRIITRTISQADSAIKAQKKNSFIIYKH